jgi:hypothetical protein
MRRVAAGLAIALAITAVGALGADSILGTWKYNAAKSKTNISNPFKNMIEVRTATPDGGVKLTRTGQRTDGTMVNGGYTCKYDGKECSVTGLAYDTITLKRIDANTVEFEARKKDGKYHSKGRSVVSSDGKTLTQTSNGTDAEGKPISQTLVFEKQ